MPRRLLHAPREAVWPWLVQVGCGRAELGDFAMMRRMLLGIKERAESSRAEG